MSEGLPSSYVTPSILLIGLPPKTFCGIDLLSFNSSPSFFGIKDLPLGLHFLFTGADASLSIRHGRWLRLTSSTEVVVFKWDSTEECLIPVRNETESMRLRANLGNVWNNGLLRYTLFAGEQTDRIQDWKNLTTYITDRTLDRILGSENQMFKWSLTSVSCGHQDVESIPGLTTTESRTEEKELGFVHIDPKQTWPSTAVGRERTEAARDFSWYLSSLIGRLSDGEDKQRGATDLLGELGFTFLMILTLSNYSCMEQWKRLLEIFTGCQKALKQVEEYFVSFVKLLKKQLMHCEGVDGGLFDLRDEGAALLKRLLARLRKNVDDVSDHDSRLDRKLAGLEEFLKEQYGWDLGAMVVQKGLLELEDGERVEMDLMGTEEDDESGEYAPVVVDLT